MNHQDIAEATSHIDRAATNFDWTELHADLRRHIVQKLTLPQAARAALVCKDFYEYVQDDPRWAAFMGSTSSGAGLAEGAYRRATDCLNKHILGPQTRALVFTSLAAAPLLAFDVCRTSYSYHLALCVDVFCRPVDSRDPCMDYESEDDRLTGPNAMDRPRTVASGVAADRIAG